ncbi:MAG: hypothetical protein AAFP84_11230 [Actinomycetota bacterium]
MNRIRRPHRLSAALVAGAVILAACGSDGELADEQLPGVDDTTDDEVVSAAAGAAARNVQARFAGRANSVAEASPSADATTSVSADSDITIDCGGLEPYEPTQAELDTANAEARELATALTRFGVEHTVEVDDLGFESVRTDWTDAVAQSVVDSWWNARFPVDEPVGEPAQVEPIDPGELEQIRAENEALAAGFDEAGIAYSRESDESGYEWITWDWENPEAEAVVAEVYAELYPPPPPTPEEVERFTEENARLTAAFDERSVAYTVVRDELGWEWVEWDYDDEALWPVIDEVFAELYPPVDCGELLSVDDPALSGPADETVLTDGDAITSGRVSESGSAVEPAVLDDFTPEQIAQRDADVAALTGGFASAGVTHEVVDESPWATVLFDVEPDAAVEVVQSVLAARS